MYKKSALLIGVCLLLLAVVFYVLLHGMNRLYIFKFVPKLQVLVDIRACLSESIPFLLYNRIVTGYLVDFLWCVSICFVLTYYFENQLSKLCIVFGIGVLSEVLQFFNSALGTFDWVDLLMYFLIVLTFGLCEMKYFKEN